MKRLLFALLASLGGLLLTLAVVELALRSSPPQAHVQIVRPDQAQMRLIDGVPTWRGEGSEAREDRGCTPGPGGARWLMLGSSIFFGSGLDPAQSPGAQLQQALGPAHCVHNFAQPAFTFQAQAAVAEEALEALHPSRVLWEIWDNSPLEYVMAGDTAYNLHGFVVGADGLPQVAGVPPALSRWLLPRSRAWELLALRSAPRDYPEMASVWQRFVQQRLRPTLRRLQEQGARPALYLAPHLDRPFAEQRADPRDLYAPVEALAQELGVPALRGEVLLADQDVQAIRLDPCCHVNAAGARVLAEALAIGLTEDPPAEDPGAPPPAP